jgi:hypothetical protein
MGFVCTCFSATFYIVVFRMGKMMAFLSPTYEHIYHGMAMTFLFIGKFCYTGPP